MSPKPILKTGTRILRPDEYEQLKAHIPKQDHRTILDCLLYTGMRYVEVERFRNHPDWHDPATQSIHLPREASRKRKRTQPDRYVYLSAQGTLTIPYFFNVNRKITQAKIWSMNLKRWGAQAGLDPTGLNARCTRKTWESWLCAANPEMIPYIAMSQGHTQVTAMRHYLNLPFTRADLEKIRIYTAGWSGMKKLL